MYDVKQNCLFAFFVLICLIINVLQVRSVKDFLVLAVGSLQCVVNKFEHIQMSLPSSCGLWSNVYF